MKYGAGRGGRPLADEPSLSAIADTCGASSASGLGDRVVAARARSRRAREGGVLDKARLPARG